ncbi:LCP family protein [Bacillus sp. MCCB 382]|uniref:LCP family protein n=1 Tax=Bacillus sp. MCCB 382 TaxID=2860197 RepID=UPI001C57766C|nr:LCP family protein [Bacillus sp. MCCB 382]
MDPINIRKAIKLTQDSLQFTKQDREEVFKKIHERNQIKATGTVGVMNKKHLFPAVATLILVSLFLLVFIPSLTGDHRDNQMLSLSNADEKEEDQVTSILVMVANEDNRTDINLLFTVNKRAQKVNVILLPPSLKVPILNADKEILTEDKLTHAFAYVGRPAAVNNTVEKALDMPIDYYFMWEREEVEEFLNSMEDIQINVKENIEMESAKGSKYTYSKGMENVSGEEMARILSIDGEHQLPPYFMNRLFSHMLNYLNSSDFKSFSQQGISNVSPEEMKRVFNEMDSLDINNIPLEGFLHPIITDGLFYVELDETFKARLSKQLFEFK